MAYSLFDLIIIIKNSCDMIIFVI